MWNVEYSPKKGGKYVAIARLSDEQYEQYKKIVSRIEKVKFLNKYRIDFNPN